MTLEVLIGTIIFIFGLVFGSFYNVVGYRLPNNMSLIYPNSHCPKCNHELKFYELVPVLSYIFLGGKCKKCKDKISIKYPIFELLTGILFLLSYIVFGLNIKFFIAITFISVLIVITISDIESYIIPDGVLITGVILIIIELIIKMRLENLNVLNGLIYPVLNGIASFTLLYLFKLFGDKVFKKESLGGGDIKLLFVIGLVLGFDMSIVTVFLASFIALPLSIVSLIKNDNNIIPFGPYLSLASVIILLLELSIDKILMFI